ncbi:TetR/AcrR family transcriptional regulator C-terminal domain-containing protein [Micromonospora carbonacea]
MRRVAAAFGVATMSLYGGVGGKGALVLAMIDVAMADAVPSGVRTSAGWRQRLDLGARTQWAAYRLHPWLAEVISLTQAQPVPSLVRFGEWNLAALARSGLDPVARFDVHLLICNYVRGLAINLSAEERLLADSGLDPDSFAGEPNPVLHSMMRDYPALAAAGDYPFDLDRLFAFGLDRLLDGVAPLTSGGAGGSPAPPR